MRPLTGTPTLVALVCLVPVSAWWFVQMMNPAGEIAVFGNTASLQAVEAVLVLQLLGIALFGPQMSLSATSGRASHWSVPDEVFIVAAFVLPALPLLAMLGLASGLPLLTLARAECVIFATGFATVIAGQRLPGARFAGETRRVMQSSLGIVAASAVWIFRQDLLLWTGL